MAKKDGPTPKQLRAARVLALIGADVLTRDRLTANLRAALEEVHGPDGVETFWHDGPHTTLDQVLDECRSYGLLGGHKIVIVDDADGFASTEARRDALIRYADTPSEAATLVLRARAMTLPKLTTAIQAKGLYIRVEPCSEDDAKAWLVAQGRERHGVTVEAGAAERLVERHGPDLARLDSELAKLALSISPGGTVTAATVEGMSEGAVELSPFAVQADLLSGDASRALGAIRAVVRGQPRDAHVPLVIAACYAAARLHEQAANGSPGKVWGDVARALGELRGRVHVDEAKALLDAALQADVDGKSGRFDPMRNVEVLAVRFAQTTRKR